MLPWRAAATVAVLSWHLSAAAAQDWPSRPVRILVGFGAGGGTDVVARIVADRLSEMFGQQFVVENKPGAGGAIAGGIAARAPNDGYTALAIGTGHAVSAVMVKQVPYDPVASFTPVGLLGTSAYVLAVPKNSPATDLKSLVALAAKEPDKLNYATIGLGSTPHLIAEDLRQRTGMKVQQVSFRTTGEVVTALLRGDVAFGLDLFHALRGQVDSGDLRLIAVSAPERWPPAPGVPTLAESGLPGFGYSAWYGLVFPAGTERAIVDKTHEALQQILANEDVKRRFEGAGAIARLSTPEELARLIQDDIRSFQGVAQKAGFEAK